MSHKNPTPSFLCQRNILFAPEKNIGLFARFFLRYLVHCISYAASSIPQKEVNK
jgi:hypothetical protein